MRGGVRRRDDPTQSVPFERKIPSCAATYRHSGGCTTHQIHARSAPGGGQRSNRRSHTPPPAVQPPAAPPTVSSAWESASGGAHHYGGRAHSPCRAGERPSASRRDRRSGGPSARTALPWARGAPGGPSTPWSAVPTVYRL